MTEKQSFKCQVTDKILFKYFSSFFWETEYVFLNS